MVVKRKRTTKGELSGEPSMITSRRIHDEQLRKVAENLKKPFQCHKSGPGQSGATGMTGLSGKPGRENPEVR
ncbi:MAG: hypothetical protein LUQ31_01165 [Methanoregula sp.]|nr:hypothetical protein [Methanoregula sp.]